MEKERDEKELTLADIREQARNEVQQKEVGALVQLIIFKLGDEEYALHIDQIKEVVLTPGIAKIPQTPDYIIGVANIRGNIISIVNLNTKFGLKDDSENVKTKRYTLVVESESFKIGVLVNEVPNTLVVPEKDIDKSSTVLQYSHLDEDCIKGIVKSGDRMIIMVDMIKMMEAEGIGKVISVE